MSNIIKVNEDDLLEINGDLYKINKDEEITKFNEKTFHSIVYTLLYTENK